MRQRMTPRELSSLSERRVAGRRQVLIAADAAEQPPGVRIFRLAVTGGLRGLQGVVDAAALIELTSALEKLQCGRYSSAGGEMRLFRPVPRISLAQRADAAGLAELYRQAWSPFQGHVDERMIADQSPGEAEVESWFLGGFEIYRATLEGDLVGAVRCSFPTGTCLIDRLAVAPESRGRGFGKFLAEHAVSRAKRAGVSKVWLYASPKLETAVGLFDALGFRESGRIQAPYWGERAVLMEMNI